MALKLYKTADKDDYFDSLDPFTVTVDGRIGGIQDHKIYLRNDDASYWYDNVSVSLSDTSPSSHVDSTQEGWYWKLSQRDIELTHEEWTAITPGTTLTLTESIGNSQLGDVVTFIPIWVRVAIPRGQDIETLTTITFQITATEYLI